MDDNFSTIINVAKWGRSVYINIQKFVQFQLTVNIVALMVNFVSASFTGTYNFLTARSHYSLLVSRCYTPRDNSTANFRERSTDHRATIVGELDHGHSGRSGASDGAPQRCDDAEATGRPRRQLHHKGYVEEHRRPEYLPADRTRRSPLQWEGPVAVKRRST
jgi:hypothetical protein